MFKKIISWFKRHGILKNENELDKKKKSIKQQIDRFGIGWADIENVMFWETPIISFLFYLVFVAIFWKLISYELQRIALIMLLTSSLSMVSEVKKIIKSFLLERSFIVIIPENKKLGFELTDVIDVSAEIWLTAESHCLYLIQLKDQKDPTLCFYLALYLGTLIILFTYIPVAEILFLFGTFLYFYPVCSYLGIIEKMFERFERLFKPIAMHWANTQTKRTRNRKFKNNNTASAGSRLTDSEEEEFVPREQNSRDHIKISDSSQESMDEFDLRGTLHMQEGHSSDYDEDSFLPQTTNGLPSFSQYDSLMEPLDDEFHAGLDFQNVSARSVSEFGVPDSYIQAENANRTLQGEDTDEDVDELPVEEADGLARYANIISYQAGSGYGQEGEVSENVGFEFVEKEELLDVTDEEINEQNIGQTKTGGIVSNMLGY